MKYKAVLSDFDNTLVADDFIVKSQDAVKIKSLKSKNVLFSIATGRCYKGVIQGACQSLSLDTLHICFGGAQIIDARSDKVVWEQHIDDATAKGIIDFFVERKIYIFVETYDTTYSSNGKRSPWMQDTIDIRHLRELKINKIPKILVAASSAKRTEKEAEALLSLLSSQYKDISIIKYRNHEGFYGVDITSEKATKHTAVLEYCKLQYLDPHEVIGIGDGYNDYPLLSACGYKIAMGDAHEDLKEIADFVAPSAKEGGIGVVLDMILTNSLPNKKT